MRCPGTRQRRTQTPKVFWGFEELGDWNATLHKEGNTLFFPRCRMAVVVTVHIVTARRMTVWFRILAASVAVSTPNVSKNLPVALTTVALILNRALVCAVCLREEQRQEEPITSTVFSHANIEPLLWNSWKQLSEQAYLPEDITMHEWSSME